MIQESLMNSVIALLIDSITIVVGVIFIAKLSLVLTPLIIIFLLINTFFSIRLGKILEKYQSFLIEKYSQYSASIQESIDSTFLIKIFRLNSFFSLRVYRKFRDYFTVSVISIKKRYHNQFYLKILSFACDFVVLLMGGYLIMQGKLTIGGLIAFTAIFKIITGPIDSFVNNLMTFKKNIPLYERIDELLFLPTEYEYSDIEINTHQSITFENVSFSYTKESSILKNITYRFLPNRIYVISGDSGSGKTTLLHLLLGLYRVNSGTIYYDDTQLDETTIFSIRKIASFVEQEPTMINDTIFNNILVGNPNANEQDIIEACQTANIYDFLLLYHKDSIQK